MPHDDIFLLEPNTNFTVELEHIGGVDKIGKVVLKQLGIVAISPQLLRDADPNILQSCGDGTYTIGPLKLSLIMPRPRHAIFTNSELFWVTVIDPNWRNYDGSPYLLEPE